MPHEFARNALVVDDIQLTTEERIRLGLDKPAHPRALSQGRIAKVTTNRIRYGLAQLIDMNIEKADGWLDEVAKDSPAKAVELLIELAQFSLPKLKAISVDVRDSGGGVKNYSVAELEKLVVSEQ